MSRPVLLLFLSLAAALAARGLLADRTLVREAASAAELSSARIEQDARTAALSVRGALGQIEQDLLTGGRPAGVRQQTLALPPGLSVSGGRPLRGRPRAELVALLLSTEVTVLPGRLRAKRKINHGHIRPFSAPCWRAPAPRRQRSLS